uniref:DUF4346 domain-containing protein n=1 Tax=Izziella formosana TaxID=1653389 RepID=A0A1G4NUQ0_9FLOR|nr:Hypothetical protein ORF_1 [Izziella formosana]SCW22334.1 Hypothetical protein ORF_1 [Izziella formosana]
MYKLDNIYCKITVIADLYICVEFNLRTQSISNKIFPRLLFKSQSSDNIIKLMSSHLSLISELSAQHSLYIGGELVKAELACMTFQEYVQS